MENLSQSMLKTNAPPQLHDFMPMPPASSRAHKEEDPKKAEFRSELKKRMEEFWEKQLKEVTDEVNNNGGDRLKHALPLTRIPKIMKMDEDVKYVGAATSMLFAKACEIFIKELTERAWIYTEKEKRKTLQRDDIAIALRDDELFSFLHNTVTLPEEATDDEDDESPPPPPPPPEEAAAKDVVHQEIYYPEPYHQYHSADRPFSYRMNTPYMNPFDQGSTSAAAANNLAIDPRIAFELNLHDISPNLMQIGGEMPPCPSYHGVAPQPPMANVNLNPTAYMNLRQFGEEMNPFHHQLAPQPPGANMNPASYMIGGQMLHNQSATRPPPKANNPSSPAFRDFWR